MNIAQLPFCEYHELAATPTANMACHFLSSDEQQWGYCCSSDPIDSLETLFMLPLVWECLHDSLIQGRSIVETKAHLDSVLLAHYPSFSKLPFCLWDTLDPDSVVCQEGRLLSKEGQRVFETRLGDSCALSTEVEPSKQGWLLETKLQGELLKTQYPVPFLLPILQNSPCFQADAAVLNTILAELFSNALEHGVLKLNSGLKSSADGMLQYYQDREKALSQVSDADYLNLIISHEYAQTNQLIFCIEDSGTGFDYKKLLERLKAPEENAQYFGRGYTLISSLCEVTFDKNGSRVIASYSHP